MRIIEILILMIEKIILRIRVDINFNDREDGVDAVESDCALSDLNSSGSAMP